MISSAHTTGTKMGKKKRVSKGDLQVQYEAILEAMDSNFNNKFDRLVEVFAQVSENGQGQKNQSKESSALPRSDSDTSGNITD